MREILFRGKRVDTGEWVEGLITHDIDGSLRSMEVYSGYFLASFYDVEPSTVGQYTGLTDKNGKRIFEGDICKVVRFDTDSYEYRSQIFLAEWIESGFGLYSQSGSDELVIFVGISDTEDIEVIGNIHDNPELLKEA